MSTLNCFTKNARFHRGPISRRSPEGGGGDMKKYCLTDKVRVDGHILYRIRALIDIPEYGVKAGDLGGFVGGESNLSQDGSCWIGDNATVYGKAKVFGNARVYGNAAVYDEAQIYDNAQVYDEAIICGRAKIYGNAKVFGAAWVYDDACVYDNAWVYDDATINGCAEVYGTAIICNTVQIYGAARISDDIYDGGTYS